jgi:hypothetical protein
MIERIARPGLIILLLVSLSQGMSGQQQDFQSRFEAGFDRRFNNGLKLTLEAGQRFRYNSTQYDRTLFTLSGDYSPTGYLDLAGGARLILASDIESRVTPRYRIHADVTGNQTVAGVDLSLRVRFQYGFEEFIYFNDFRSNTLVNRIRLKAGYHFFGTRIGAYGYLESWGLVTDNNGHFFKRMRYSLGAAYTLSFRSSIGIGYILEDEFNQANPLRLHILEVTYSHSL